MPSKGLLEFDYVTWKRGLEATFKLDLANPCELFIAEQVRSCSPLPKQPRWLFPPPPCHCNLLACKGSTPPMLAPSPRSSQLFAKTAAAESEGGNEALRDCRLDNTPLEPGSELPAQGMLHVVYFSTAPKDEVDFDLKLELAAPNDRVMCQRVRASKRFAPAVQSARKRARALRAPPVPIPWAHAARSFACNSSLRAAFELAHGIAHGTCS
eukprot:6808059-Prymnesium_polylepis.2